MSWSWTLYRYLARQYFVGVGVIFATFMALAYSISLVDLLGRTAGKGVPTSIVIGMGFLHLPDLGQKLLPFAVLLGGVFTFVRLSRSQELVATRAAGVSAWDFLAPPLVVAVALGVLAVTIGTPVSAKFLSRFAALEAKYVHGEASQLAVSINGLWLRQGDAQHQSVIHALRVSDQGSRLDEVIIFLTAPTTNSSGGSMRSPRSLRKARGNFPMHGSAAPTAHPRNTPSINCPQPSHRRASRKALLLPIRFRSGICRASFGQPRPQVSPQPAISFISTRCWPCQRCSRPWSS